MSDSMQAIRDICSAITKQVDRAYVAEHGRHGEVPTRLWELWAETGLLGLGIPEEYGGSGGGLTEVCYATDLLHRAGLEMPHGTPNHMSRTTIARNGTAEQKARYLPPTVTGERCFAFAITEPDAGTNTFKIRTNARRRSDGSYVLNGQKHFVTNFSGSDHALVVVRTAPPSADDRTSGLSLLIVDTKYPGISATPMDIGIYLPDRQYVVNFDDVVVPTDNIVGEPGKGLHALFDSVNPERLLTSGKSLGLADFVLERAADYARTRAPFDTPIGAYQSIQHPMALAKCRIEAARALLYNATRKFDEGGNTGLEANMAKFLSADAFKAAADIAMTTFGGAGMDMQQDVLPFYLRAKLAEVAPLTNNVVLGFIAQQGLHLPKSY
jgi:alkylation response protein AidB-like acyl-CoA dehydrogenase